MVRALSIDKKRIDKTKINKKREVNSRVQIKKIQTVHVVRIYLRVSFEHGFPEGNIVYESFNLALHPPITKFDFT